MTIDCPICLSPLSAPWGVANPCGHPYHRECWDAVLAACSNGGAKKKKECPMCKCQTKRFQQVFVQLGGDENEVENGSGAVGVSEGGNDVLDELLREWDTLWKKLQSLLSCKEAVGSMNVVVDDLCINTASDDDCQGTQEIQDICATIDLTQYPARSTAESCHSQSQVSLQLVRNTDKHEKRGSEPTEQLDQESDLKEQQLKQTEIQHILSRLHQIHSTLMNVAPVSTSKNTSQLKSKFLSLKKTNSLLESEISRLESEKSTLQDRLNTASEALLERNFETEKEKRNAANFKQEYMHLFEVHNSYQDRARRQIENLKQSNAELQKKCHVLQTANGLSDVKEMEEIRMKYSKMSNQLHDATKENRALTRRIEEMERRRNEGERIRRDVERERHRKDLVSRKGLEKENYRTISERSSSVDISTTFKTTTTSSTSTDTAMQALDAAPSRNTIHKTKSNAPSYQKTEKRISKGYNQTRPNDIRCTDNFGIADEEELEIDEGIQLFMKPSTARNYSKKRHYSSTTTATGSIGYAVANTNHAEQQTKTKTASTNSIAFQRQSSINSVQSTTSQTKRMLKEYASVKSSKKGVASQSISNFFKPIEK